MKNENLEQLLQELLLRHSGPASAKRGSDGVSYSRVSSLEQLQGNGSIDLQKKQISEYALRNKINIVENFGGTYESAKSDGRKEFQRMLKYVKQHKNIGFIIVANYDRFSRTGAAAAKLSEELRKEGIIVKSATQDIDTSTSTGRLQENFLHLLNNFDNATKSDRTKTNTKEVMLKGYWPYATPLGYVNVNKKQRACFHVYKITNEGELLKKGFELKAEGKLTNNDIVEYLSVRGVKVSANMFRLIIANPFYAGYVTGKLVNGQLIKGHHPPLVDLATFLKANEVLKNAPTAGVAKVFRHEQVPLKIFVKDEISGQPFTGYSTKNNWYYKTKSKTFPTNVKAEKLNDLFVQFLKLFEYDKKYKPELKKLFTKGLEKKLFQLADDKKLLKKKLTEKNNELQSIEMKFLSDAISKDVYDKHTARVKAEIAILVKELEGTGITSSNLEKAVEKCLTIACNISTAWLSATFEQKQRLQYLVFPEGINYNKEIGVVRTEKINSLFCSIPILQRVIEENKKGNLSEDYLKISKVP
jgi:DNA invertase Pin-like site-specific DNA recombinase